jgi:hypothetical protein
VLASTWTALLRRLVVPVALYAVAFSALTWPRLTQFSTHFFGDRGDGLQNVWNLWWIRKALVELHQSPWHTDWLHYPFGFSLHGHTLNPLNGLLGVGLQSFLTLVQTYNALIVFAFVAGGLTAFWLALHVSGSYGGSLLGGYVFTFSEFHFAHAEGHMNLVSLEWLPLFLLLAVKCVEGPTVGLAVGTALALFAVQLCDPYYFFYGALAAVLLVLWTAWRRKDLWFWTGTAYRRPAAAFLLAGAATSGVLLGAFAWSDWADPFVGGHQAEEFSLDLLALLVPGGHWRFASLTGAYWSRLPGNIHESSVYLGYGVLVLVACAWRGRRAMAGIGYWYLLLAFFAVMALGPALHVWGRQVTRLPLPYSLLTELFPPLRLSGVPVRMAVMVTLAAAVIAASGVRRLWEAGGWRRATLLPLLILIGIESLPRPIPASAPRAPEFVEALREGPGRSAYIEISRNPLPPGLALYLQTQHEQPMAFGYTSRTTRSLLTREAELRRLADDGQWKTLACDRGFRWLLTDTERPLPVPGRALTVETRRVWLYEIGVLCRRDSASMDSRRPGH